MVVVATESKTEITDLLFRFIDTRMAEGIALGDAVDRAVGWLRSEGLMADFFEEHAETVVRDLWRKEQAARRNRALHRSSRVLETGPLKAGQSLFEALYAVNGHWRRLGEMTVEDCQWLEGAYRDASADNMKKSQFFATILKRMEGGQRVRDVYSENDLRLMHEQS